MKPMIFLLLAVALIFGVTACGGGHSQTAYITGASSTVATAQAAPAATAGQGSDIEKSATVKIKITVGHNVLDAILENNATTRALVSKMPMTLRMQDLYGREMCYRYGAQALPTEQLRADGYAVGDIAYWPPGGSLVILYEQNGEQFERQHLGHILSGVEIFKSTGTVDVCFAVAEE